MNPNAPEGQVVAVSYKTPTEYRHVMQAAQFTGTAEKIRVAKHTIFDTYLNLRLHVLKQLSERKRNNQQWCIHIYVDKSEVIKGYNT